MAYFEELKTYQLFDLVKQKIIIRRNVRFDEKSYGIKLLNSYSILLQDDPLDVVFDIGSLVPFFIPSTRQSNFLLVSRPSTSESTSSLSSISNGPSTEDTRLLTDLLK
jgi:hypothetical protein